MRQANAAGAGAAAQTVCPAGFRDRLDKALPALLPGLSRAEARRLIAAGAVFVDGRRCRVASRMVAAGVRLNVGPARTLDEPPTGPLTVLYQDDFCIAVDKPAGMPSVATPSAAAGTAHDRLRGQLRAAGKASQLWVVHRLDRDTSGVLLFAADRTAAAALSERFRSAAVHKEYVAVVAGEFEAARGSIDLPIGTDRRRARVDPAGRPACTQWEVIERGGDSTLVRLLPRSGRMHQLRVHLQAIGHPILGDRWYGGPPADRLMLHAARLRFPHPSSGREVCVDAPAPRGFRAGPVAGE